MTTDTRLTTKQEAFVSHYIALNGNATQAAIAAGYSQNTAAETGYENLRKPQIANAIELRKQELARSGELKTVSPEWVISKLAERASDDSSPASSVAALRTLADILGMTAGKQQALPAHVTAFMDFLAGKVIESASKQPRTLEILPSSLPGDSEQDTPE